MIIHDRTKSLRISFNYRLYPTEIELSFFKLISLLTKLPNCFIILPRASMPFDDVGNNFLYIMLMIVQVLLEYLSNNLKLIASLNALC